MKNSPVQPTEHSSYRDVGLPVTRMSSTALFTLVTLTWHLTVSRTPVCQTIPVLDNRLTDGATGIERIGTISVDFTNVDMSRFEQRVSLSQTHVEYNLDFEIGVQFRSDEGVLRCFCLADGKTIGVTKISFADLAR